MVGVQNENKNKDYAQFLLRKEFCKAPLTPSTKENDAFKKFKDDRDKGIIADVASELFLYEDEGWRAGNARNYRDEYKARRLNKVGEEYDS